MVNRAEQFIEQFNAAVTLMMEKSPKDLCICVSIYARDPANRTEQQPDGEMLMTSATRASYFDQATFKEYVNQFYNNI